MTDDAYAAWSRLHGGLDPTTSAWVSGWVRLTHACARPLARLGVAPNAVTVAGVLLTAVVPVLAALGAAWPMLGTLVLVVAAVLDGVDGALAAQTGTDSDWGRVVDPLADRCSDLLLVLALVVLGAPVVLGVAVGVLTMLLESVRSTAQAIGPGALEGPGAITVWERPSRVVVAAFGTFFAGLEWVARGAGVDLLPWADAALLATTALLVGLVLAVVGTGHLLLAVRRQLR